MFKSLIAIATISLASLISIPSNAGVVGGPRYATSVVISHGTDLYDFYLTAGQLTLIAVHGDHDSDLDCYLYDSGGNQVDKDDDETDECRLVVTPKWRGVFRLVLRNRGVANAYSLETN